MPFSFLPATLSACFSHIVGVLDRRSAPRLFLLLCGALFARGRRTVTSWFRPAGITTAFRRAYNTYGEDPLLTSQMGAAVITGIQSQHVMAVAKHFIGFDGLASDVFIDQQALHEIYLPPFEAAVKAGVAAAARLWSCPA